MIQRIQTIYLLLAVAFGTSMFFSTQITFVADIEYILNYAGIHAAETNANSESMATVALTILLILTPLVSLVSIFLFKRRMIQIRLCAANVGLLIGTTALIYYFGTVGMKQLNATALSYGISTVFPIVAAILNILALRAIGKDEALVRSMDRIR
ncbi:DUF4293 domain-containing protein [Saccharicrinis fermentans]|uniref:DUF4293 domain-containing protein n=1 Tax=Saccharicrinis fermentans DSM 9555 = JCM 21142 TaxID=869213 RepID=W7Y3U0_9BACT|nr:DUF4293 domain-containing protein [Saccharicrinis fermentans]GAF02248.1 hypothetical protein JCM21142_3877 [Saccharicrinis fermentans DSM 9555 = JCM 21142]